MTRLMLSELKGLDRYNWLLDGKSAYWISLYMERKSALESFECFPAFRALQGCLIHVEKGSSVLQ